MCSDDFGSGVSNSRFVFVPINIQGVKIKKCSDVGMKQNIYMYLPQRHTSYFCKSNDTAGDVSSKNVIKFNILHITNQFETNMLRIQNQCLIH